jgi:4-amino-4-deoxy-L-arabinose transferase-like glycosyltransferase
MPPETASSDSDAMPPNPKSAGANCDLCARLARSRWAAWALLALSLLMFAPGIASLPVTDRDEARYAQASRQMAESGDYVHIRFQDEARNKKPVGAYWLQAAAARIVDRVASGAIWPYRLPSLIGATAAVLLLFALARPAFGPKAAFLAAGLLAASVLAASEAHLAKTDALLLATAVAAQLALVRIYLARANEISPSIGLALTFWIAQGLAILIKGPVVPFVSLLTVAALALSDRRTRWLGSLGAPWGIPLALLIAALCFVAWSLGGAGPAGDFMRESIGNDLIPKLLGGQERHGGWPGTYLLLSPLTFWPGSLLLLPALIVAWRERARPEVRALLAWLVPAWIAMELIPTKLPHYVLPLYPALALLVARAAVDRASELGAIFGRVVGRLWLGFWIVLGFALSALGIAAVLALHDGGATVPAIALFVAGATLAIVAAVLARRGRFVAALGFATALAVPFHALLFGGVAPRLDSLWLSRAAATMVADQAGTDGSTVASAGYSEPSLVFMLGTGTLLTDGKGAADALAGGRAALAVVEQRQDTAFRDEAARLGIAPKDLASVTGLNYSRGQATTLRLYGASGQ